MKRKQPEVLVGPMRPLIEGGDYDPLFHTYTVLAIAELGVSYEGDPDRPVLVHMPYTGDGEMVRGGT